ncbi:MAG: ATP-binding protein [Candidatus Methanoplasma sp.]|nr:ATP-binding protein [Candidatus Methanoplasma sp.]
MKDITGTVLREDYIKKLDAARDRTDVAKIITGVRRCGKSTLMMQYMEHLRNAGVDDDQLFYINLESEDNMEITDHLKLGDIIKKNIRKDIRMYVFFDEIQRVTSWERNLNSLMVDYDADIYITGSNAYLLSSELATYISGRYAEIKMLPLSFKEYLELHPSFASEEKGFNAYLRYGALPPVDPTADDSFITDYLQGIYNTVLVKDVLKRLELRNPGVLERLSLFMYSNMGSLTNVLKISQHLRVSPNTIRNYLTALEEAYIVYKAERYDVRGKKILSSIEKYYASDLGLRNAMIGWKNEEDIGRMIENIVYLELRRRGYNVMVGSFRDAEVDFAAFRGDRVEYYQVTRSMLSEEVSERETRSFKMIADSYPKTILSLDKILVDPGGGIRHANLLDWLLGRDGQM